MLVKNTKKVGAFNLQLIKEDNKGTKLAGAEFEITITDKEGKVVYKTATGKTEKTDSNGLINLSNLNIESAGKVYTVKIHETKAPTGYIAGADVTFTAESQDNSAKTGYELKPVTKTGVSGSEVTITNTMITVLIKNTQKVGSYAVNLVKVDKQGHIISKEVSKFTINGEDAETSNGYLRVASAKEITKDGQIDTYKIVETEAPKGYELKPVTKTGVSGSEVTITNTMITVLIKNTQKVGSYAVNLVKVDKQGHIISKEVSKFTINGEDAETSNGYLRVASAKEITKDGQIDTYKIVETEAPKGYEKYLQEIALTVVGQETSNGYAVDTRKN